MIRSLLVCITLSFSCLDIFGASVLIYKDDGVDETSFERAYSFFESRGNIVGTIDSGSLIGSKDWMSKCDKFVIPGGADCPYDRKLKGIGCSNIREFVRNGGTYIGICAGGYFGCKKVEFALGTDLEVNEGRELAFFPGIARGPMLKPYVYDSEEGASAACVRSLIDGNIFYSYHNGGSTFVLDGVDLTNITVLAEYANADNAPAVVKCKYGKGEAILSGIHYEDDKNLLLSTGKDLEILKPIAEKIESTSKFREKFLNAVF